MSEDLLKQELRAILELLRNGASAQEVQVALERFDVECDAHMEERRRYSRRRCRREYLNLGLWLGLPLFGWAWCAYLAYTGQSAGGVLVALATGLITVLLQLGSRSAGAPHVATS